MASIRRTTLQIAVQGMAITQSDRTSRTNAGLGCQGGNNVSGPGRSRQRRQRWMTGADRRGENLTSHGPRTPCIVHRPPLTAHRSPLTAHRSPLTAHRSQLTAHRSPLTAHRSPLTAHRSPLTAHRSPLTTHSSPLTAHSSPLTAHHSPLTVHRSPLTAHRHRPPQPLLQRSYGQGPTRL